MKLRELNTLIESTQYLYEGLNADALHTVKLWESAGRQLREAELTADQIQQIFAQAEQGATAAGSNRTMIGQGKDAAVAINKAWEDLKTKVSTSGPIKGVDAMYDAAVQKIEAGLGGPDNAINQVIQKYRTFAKEHPIAQGLIYSALIAAAGITGAGLGGAAALGLFKMVDKLLQGDKFSSAAYSGAKTGAMAYGASKIGDMIRGKPEAGVPADAPGVPADAPSAQLSVGQELPNGETISGLDSSNANAGVTILKPNGTTYSVSRDTAHAMTGQTGISNQVSGPVSMGAVGDPGAGIQRESYVDYKKTLYHRSLNEALGDKVNVLHLTEAGVQHIFQLAEGPLDWIKQKAGQAMGAVKNKVATVGKNLTTKVTADKLNSAWTKAGSPTDSEQVKQIMQGAGVAPEVIAQVYKTAGIPDTAPAAPQAGATPGATPAAPQAGAPTTPGTPATPGTPGTDPKPTGQVPSAQGGGFLGGLAKGLGPEFQGVATALDAYGQTTGGIKTNEPKFGTPGTPATPGEPVTPTPAPTPTPTPTPAPTPTPTPAPTPAKPNFGQKGAMPNKVTYDPKMLAKPGAKPAPTTAATPEEPAATQTAANPFGQMAGTLKTYAPPETTSTGGTLKQTATGQVNRASATNPNAQPQQATTPAATAPKDARFPNGKYDGVTGETTPEWQAELDKQDADAKAKAAALPQLGAPPAAKPVPTASAQADTGKPGFQQSKLKGSTVPAATTTPTATVPQMSDADMDAAEQAQLAKMQAKNPKLAGMMQQLDAMNESRVDFGAMLFKRMKSGR